MKTKGYRQLGRITALISFIIGSVIFGLYFFTSSSILLFVGYRFIMLCLLLNVGVLAILFIKVFKDKENVSTILGSCGLMLLNITALIFYLWFTLMLLGTVRITFTNNMDTVLNDIKIVGCGGGHIEELGVGKRKTVWVEIPSDCSIHLEYIINGKKMQETVVGYTTRNDGQKLKHSIAGNNSTISTREYW